MPNSEYQQKYIQMIKLYHELHAINAEFKMKMTIAIRDLKTDPILRNNLYNVIDESTQKIEETDLKFRDLIRANTIVSVLTKDEISNLVANSPSGV